MSRRRAIRFVGGPLLVGACLALGCSGGAVEEPDPPAPVLDPVAVPEESEPAGPMCEPVDGPLAPDAGLSPVPISYRLTLVRGDAGERPAWVEGTLRLEPRPAELRRREDWSAPLQGTAEIELEQVGAHRVGSLESDDLDAPGVLVLVDRAEPTILLRFGSAANRTDRQVFDQAFTVLDVLEVDDNGFAGSWRSGLFGDQVTGFFCAVREGAS